MDPYFINPRARQEQGPVGWEASAQTLQQQCLWLCTLIPLPWGRGSLPESWAYTPTRVQWDRAYTPTRTQRDRIVHSPLQEEVASRAEEELTSPAPMWYNKAVWVGGCCWQGPEARQACRTTQPLHYTSTGSCDLVAKSCLTLWFHGL